MREDGRIAPARSALRAAVALEPEKILGSAPALLRRAMCDTVRQMICDMDGPVAHICLDLRQGVLELPRSRGSPTAPGGYGRRLGPCRRGFCAELLEAVKRLGPDAVLTDIRMPPDNRTDGIDAAHEIRSAHPGVGVVVLSQYADVMYAFELFKFGTAGLAYLLKDRVADSGQIVSALREVLDGGSVIDPQVVEGLVLGQPSAQPSALDTLTEREKDVLRLMAEGRSNGGIAATLVLSDSAVEKHVGSIFAKLGLHPEPTTHRRVAAVLAFLGGLRR